MKRTIKVLSVALAITMVLVVSLLGVMASVQANIVIAANDYTELKAENSTYDLTYSFANDGKAIYGAEIELSWNSMTADVKEITPVGKLAESGVTFTADIEGKTATVIWSGSAISAEDATGDLFKVTFDKGDTTSPWGTFEVKSEVVAIGNAITRSVVSYALDNANDTALLSDGAAVTEYTVDDAADAEATFNAAVLSAFVSGEDVTINLNADWVLSESIAIGSADKIPAGTITVTGTGSIWTGDVNAEADVIDSYVLGLYGNFVFENIGIYGVKGKGAVGTTNEGKTNLDYSNALFAPDGASITIESSVVTDETNKANIGGGNLTIKGGNFHVVAGNTMYSGYNITNGEGAEDDYANITITDATVDKIIGGAYNNNGENGETFERKTNLVVNGATNIKEALLAGSWGSEGTLNGGKLELDTTGTFASGAHFILVSYGPTKEAAKDAANKYVIDWKNGTPTGKFWEVASHGAANTKIYVNAEINIYTAPGKVGYLGASPRDGASEQPFDVEGTIVANIKSGTTLTQTLVAGSNFQRTGDTSNLNITLNVEKGATTKAVYGGPNVDSAVVSCTVNDTTTINVGKTGTEGTATMGGNLYGGGTIYAPDVTYGGTTTINVGNGSVLSGWLVGGGYLSAKNINYTRNTTINLDTPTLKSSIYGGSNFLAASTGSVHSGNTAINITTITSGNCKNIYGGSTMAAAGTHSGDIAVSMYNVKFQTSGQNYYGGSYLNAADAKHTGGITTDIMSYCTFSVASNGTNVYGGSHINNAGAMHDSAEGKQTVVNLIPNRAKNVKTGPQFDVGKVMFAGGSYIAVAGTADNYVTHKGDVIVNVNAGTIRADVYGVRISKNYNKHIGNVTVNFEKLDDGDTLDINSSTGRKICPALTSDKYCVLEGDSKLYFGNGATLDRTSSNGTKAAAQLYLVAGVYGYGTMKGDSTLELANGSNIAYYANNTIVTAGCLANTTLTNDANIPYGDGTSLETPYGNTRQDGSVNFIMTGNCQLNTAINVAGYRSNITGDVNITLAGDSTGNPKINTNMYGLCNPADGVYASAAGNMNVYLTGSPYLKYASYIGGNHSSTYNPATNGYNVVAGNIFVEMEDYKTNFNGDYKLYISNYAPLGDVVIKVVGDCEIDFAKYNTYAQKPDYAADMKQYLDLTQYTGEGVISGTGFTNVYQPITEDTEFGFGGLTSIAQLQMTDSTSIRWSTSKATYAELTQFNDNFRNKNEFEFVTVLSGEEPSVSLKFNGEEYAVKATEFTTNILSALNSLGEDFSFRGTSIRPYSFFGAGSEKNVTMAMRFRARINDRYFKDDNADGILNSVNGYTVKQLGILLSSGADADLLTLENAKKVMYAYNDGEYLENGWAIEKNPETGRNDGYNYFAAAITGYNTFDENGVVYNTASMSKIVNARAFIVLTDWNGNEITVYAESPSMEGENVVYSHANYSKSFSEVIDFYYNNYFENGELVAGEPENDKYYAWLTKYNAKYANMIKDIVAAR